MPPETTPPKLTQQTKVVYADRAFRQLQFEIAGRTASPITHPSFESGSLEVPHPVLPSPVQPPRPSVVGADGPMQECIELRTAHLDRHDLQIIIASIARRKGRSAGHLQDVGCLDSVYRVRHSAPGCSRARHARSTRIVNAPVLSAERTSCADPSHEFVAEEPPRVNLQNVSSSCP